MKTKRIFYFPKKRTQPKVRFCILEKTITMKLFRFTLVCILTFNLFFSCTEDNRDPINQVIDNGNGENNDFAQNFGSTIYRTFLGTVMDQNHNPLQSVTITIGDATAQTDAHGVFIIQDAQVYERFGYIKAEKEGYLTGSRSVVPSEGTNKVNIILLEESIAGTVSSGSEETVSLPNGASVKLPGSYVTSDGTSYSGTVSVVLHLLDPTEDDMTMQMPGMLYGANADNEERMLQSYGMLAVELLGDSGEKLNLAEDSTAEITVPLDVSLQTNAPTSIPLWHFDEDGGYWVEDGEATLTGTTYVGSVSHFSFWNCDIPAEAINLCINLTDENGNSLSNLWTTITSEIYGTRGGNTNELGQVCGLVPSNESLEVNIYNYDMCGATSLFTTSIGPYSSDSSEDIIIITLPSDVISETVTGNFNTCNDDPVTDGYVFLLYQDQTHSTLIDDGTFEFNLLRCDQDDTFKVIGNDYVNLQTTDTLNYTFTTPLTNIGTISACNDAEEFITYQVDDHAAINYINSIESGLDGTVLYVNVYSPNQEYFFYLHIENFSDIGTYTNNANMSFFDMNLDSTSLETVFEGSINVNSFGDIGEYIDINFSGNLVDWNNPESPTPITGSIHVLRNN